MKLGFFFCAMYSLSVAVSGVIINKIGGSWPIMVTLFYTSIITSLFFILLDINNFKKNISSIYDSPLLFFIVSISIAINWFSAFYVIINTSPHYLLSLHFLTYGIISTLKNKQVARSIIIILAIFLCTYAEEQSSSLNLFLSILSGTSSYIYLVSSCRLSRVSLLNVKGLLSIRYYFLILLSLFAINMNNDINQLFISLSELKILFIISFLNMVIPLYFMQSALEMIGADRTSKYLTLTPVVTFILDAIFNSEWNPLMFSCCLGVYFILNINKGE